MASCIRIDPRDFHGPAADAYTQRALEDLAKSKQFRSYMNHVEYKERLHLTWFLIPLGLVSVFYYHLSVFNPDFMLPLSNITASMMEGRAASAVGLPYMALFVLLFLLPCTLVAPFAGFFEEPSWSQSVRLFVLLTLVNVAVASYGGSLLHFPPFLHTLPEIPWVGMVAGREDAWESSGAELWTAMRVLAVRVVPLQGFLCAGFAVSRWQRSYWRRVWHVPFPLLTVPCLVGLAGVLFWRVSSLTLPYVVDDKGALTSAGAYSWEALSHDPHAVLSLWSSIGREVAMQMVKDAQEWWAGGGGLPAVLADTTSCLHAYLAALSMALIYFAMLAVRPFLEFFIAGVCLLLPVDPTIWGLAVASSIGALVALARMEEMVLPYVAAVSGLVFLLLYNGFVA